MDNDLRASRAGAAGGLAGGAAAALSAIVGLLSGVPFGALLLRALAAGLLFGAFVLGAGLLLLRLLPELFGAAGPEPEAGLPREEAGPLEAGAEELGRRLDIVLPGGSEEEFPASPLVRGPAELEEALGFEGGSLLEREEAAPEASSFAAAALPSAGSPGFDELDVLPDLESLSDSFLEVPVGSASFGEAREAGSGGQASPRPSYEGGASYGASYGGSGSGSPAGGATDPATLAQAVRTLLKRDQKG